MKIEPLSKRHSGPTLSQSLEVIGDGAEVTDLAVASGFGNGDDDGVLMDIETEV